LFFVGLQIAHALKCAAFNHAKVAGLWFSINVVGVLNWLLLVFSATPVGVFKIFFEENVLR